MSHINKTGVKIFGSELNKLKDDLMRNGYFQAGHAIDHVTKQLVVDYEQHVKKKAAKGSKK